MALVLAFPQNLSQMFIQRFKILIGQGCFFRFRRFWFDVENKNKDYDAYT